MIPVIPKEHRTKSGKLTLDYATKIARQIQMNQPHISVDRIPDLAKHIVDSGDGLYSSVFHKDARKLSDIDFAIDWAQSGVNGCKVNWSNVHHGSQVPKHNKEGEYE